jgi:hypothetical protein
MPDTKVNFIKMYLYDSLSKEKAYVDIMIKSEKVVMLDSIYVVPINDNIENLIAGFPYEKLSDTKYRVRLNNL